MTMASGNIPAALKKQLEAADKFFADGNLRSAKIHADLAKNLFPSVPEAHRAHAAFKVHAAAANKGKLGKPDYYAVLGVTAPLNGKPTRETYDAVKSQHRALCDLLDPAKSSSSSNAATAAAYKLVNEAFAALTDIKKAAPAHAPPPRPRQTWLGPRLRPKVPATPGVAYGAPAVAEEEEETVEAVPAEETTFPTMFDEPQTVHKEQGAAEEEKDISYYGGGRSRRGREIPIIKY